MSPSRTQPGRRPGPLQASSGYRPGGRAAWAGLIGGGAHGRGLAGSSVRQGRGQALGAGWRACLGGTRALAHLSAVLAVAEVVQVAVVRVAGSIRGPRAHLAGVDPILLQELAVGDAEGLADGLGDKLGLLGGQQAPSHPTKPQFQGPHLQETSQFLSQTQGGGRARLLTSSEWKTWHSIL